MEGSGWNLMVKFEGYGSYGRMDSEKFQNFHFQAKIVIFEVKIIKMVTRVSFRVFTNSSYIWILLT